ncbi:hypothetical protein AYI70_g3995 [Smittium culicis]|uniref:Uncharacterized protein n=1 Tax=Smittium culicis TaxID=133412 RepID=A0A1R1Y142_9FUNG|nr:hypothetical protein AYI70_g3995 [Smittium culicis]
MSNLYSDIKSNLDELSIYLNSIFQNELKELEKSSNEKDAKRAPKKLKIAEQSMTSSSDVISINEMAAASRISKAIKSPNIEDNYSTIVLSTANDTALEPNSISYEKLKELFETIRQIDSKNMDLNLIVLKVILLI